MQNKTDIMKEKSTTADKTVLKGISWLGTYSGFNIAAVDVKNGKIVRIRPLHYDWKYETDEFGLWEMKARGKVFKPKMKTLLPPLTIAYKKRVYSPNRIKYPLKRVDWDPNGKRNPENRGKSKYERISWDEATDLIISELKRVQEKYGPAGVLMQSQDHGETKVVHASHYCPNRLLNIMGGFTKQMRNPDSWEGWYWGAKHMWGMDPFGLMVPQGNIFLDVSKNTDMLLYWGCDPETTVWYRSGQAASRLSYWFTELGIKCIYICPDLNYGAAVHADKWIPILPNTDAALHLAISYIWITDGTYDKEYITTHTVGFEKFRDYVIGKEDGLPKTPQWASSKCGVPVWTIKALAKKWALTRTSTIHFCGGGKIRGPFSHEPARLEVANLAMQGLGKPGVHQVTTVPPIQDVGHSTVTSMVDPCVMAAHRADKKDPIQHIPQTHIHKALLEASYENPISWYSAGQGVAGKMTEGQFVKHTYPMPREEGGGEVHMIWTDGPCLFTCWNHSNKLVDAYRSPKIECIVAQHPWLENDCVFADIIIRSIQNWKKRI